MQYNNTTNPIKIIKQCSDIWIDRVIHSFKYPKNDVEAIINVQDLHNKPTIKEVVTELYRQQKTHKVSYGIVNI